MVDYTKYVLKSAEELESILARKDNLFVVACNKCFKEFSTTEEPECGAFAAIADEAVIVTCGGSGSLRGAERMARVLEDDGVPQVRLVVNRIRRRLIRRGAIGTVDDAMDATGLCLLGIVPEDEEVSIAAGNGRPAL